LAGATSSYRRAVQAHREALGLLAAVRERLERLEADSTHSADSAQQQTALAVQMERVAAEIAPDWLGAPWNVINQRRFGLEPRLTPGREVMIRVADAQPLPGVGFPVILPFIGVGHIAVDRDARDPVVAGLLRSLIVRLLASYPPGMLRLLAVDGGALGAPLAPFRALVPVGLMNEPVTELDEFRGVLDDAEEQVRRVQSGAQPDPDVMVLVTAALPPGCGRGDYARLAALAHAGPAARVHLLLAGYPPASNSSWEKFPALELTTTLTADPGSRGHFRVGDPAGGSFSAEGRGLNSPVTLDPAPAADLMEEVCRRVAARAQSEGALEFDHLVPADLWTESSVDGLRTVIGRIGRSEAVLALDDVTPHWLVGGRTGSGKTVFLLDVLYGLTARYSPDEMALYLLDFKEGVSFTEFIPTDRDPSWVPHARAVGVESDREYGLAVLSELVREMSRRAAAMKQAGVTNLAQLRSTRRDIALPRILTVIDEFHVLFQGNDETAKRAVTLLEEVARKGRSYGIHLILASQSISGIEAFYTKGQSVFGQFGMRVALSGGGGVLDVLNSAADSLPLGHVILNKAAGVPGANLTARFPDADSHSISLLRHRLWQMRTPGAAAPALFVGYAEQQLADDPTYVGLTPSVRRRSALVGRAVDIGLTSVRVTLDATPGRHLAVLGTSLIAADVLSAAALSLAKQHEPGTATFVLAGLVPDADPVVDSTATALDAAGHHFEVTGVAGYRDTLRRLAAEGFRPDSPQDRTYLLVYGADAASSLLKQPYPDSKRKGIDDLREVLRDGPMNGFHVLGWWRGVRRFTDDLGSGGKDEVSAVMALNVRGTDLHSLFGQFNLEWSPRSNRALLFDRSEDSRRLLVPFVQPGRLDDLGV
jgi:DNA segregation ATPase FtsK/SpoIIIE, S-DNA-T family